MTKTAEEIVLLREGGRRLAEILKTLALMVAPGVTTNALDERARELIAESGDEPAFLDYQSEGMKRPYPAALCVSINDEVVHGVPSERALVEGDIITLDLGLCHKGLYTDSAITVPVGEISEEAKRLIETTRESLMAGIKAIHAGARLGDIGAAVAAVAKRGDLGIVRELGGHGVGYAVHEGPLIPNYGTKGSGLALEAGMVLAIEPMLTLGEGRVKLGKDGFTYLTRDGSLAAHFEHTIVVTDRGAEILTTV